MASTTSKLAYTIGYGFILYKLVLETVLKPEPPSPGFHFSSGLSMLLSTRLSRCANPKWCSHKLDSPWSSNMLQSAQSVVEVDKCQANSNLHDRRSNKLSFGKVGPNQPVEELVSIWYGTSRISSVKAWQLVCGR